MNKKSIISIMVFLTLSTAMFVGCGNKKVEKEKVKVENSIDNDKKEVKEEPIKNQSQEKEDNTINNNLSEEVKGSNESKKTKVENKHVNKNDNKKQDNKVTFNPQKAIEIAKQKYGTQKGNILYSYKEEPYISGDKKGYYVKLSSKTMIEQGGTGTLTWLLVMNNGKIIEDPKMN